MRIPTIAADLAHDIAHVQTIRKLREWGTRAATQNRLGKLSREDQTQIRVLYHDRLAQLRRKVRPLTIVPAPKARLGGGWE